MNAFDRIGQGVFAVERAVRDARKRMNRFTRAPGQRRKEPARELVRLRCAACRTVSASIVDRDGAAYVRAAEDVPWFVAKVSCPTDGPLDVDWQRALGEADRARHEGRVRVVWCRPM